MRARGVQTSGETPFPGVQRRKPGTDADVRAAPARRLSHLPSDLRKDEKNCANLHVLSVKVKGDASNRRFRHETRCSKCVRSSRTSENVKHGVLRNK